MLMNIAEDLKEYAKIKVSPIQESEGAKVAPDAKLSKKSTNIDDLKK
jgi:hypothetical protein